MPVSVGAHRAAIRVDGLRELERAFTAADKALRTDLRDALEEAAQPVRQSAQSLALGTIGNMRRSPQWSRMRTGVLGGTVAYVAPVERGTKGRANQRLRRRKFKQLMLSRAMEPALIRNRDTVEKRLDRMLTEVARVWDAHGK